MPHKLVASPSTLPVSVDDLKAHLRVVHDQEDTLIRDLCEVARDVVETATGRTLINTVWVYSLDGFPIGRQIEIPRSPLVSVSSVRYYDSSGTLTLLSSDDYTVVGVGERFVPGAVELNADKSWPTTQDRSGSVLITYTAGFGTSRDNVPAAAKHLIRLLVAHWYENREGIVVGTITKEIEYGVKSLMQTLRSGTVAGAYQ